MNIRPKTVRRLVILFAGCGLITLAAVSVLFFSHRSKERQIQAARSEGLDAYKSGNYPVALDKLHIYIGKHQDDFDAMYAYADSRSRVETASGRHLIEAKQILEQLHGEKPDDMQVSHKLLELYDQIGYTTEAAHVADEVLASDPKDVEALRTKATALTHAGKLNEALTASQQLNDADPLDVDGQIQTLNLLRLLKHAPTEIVSRYQALQQAHPDDPRFEMLLGLAYFSGQDQPNTLKWLRSAAKRTPPDAAFVQRLSRYFDDLKLFNESRDLLERAAANGNHPDVVKILVERFWQNGRYQEVVDRLKDLDANSDADADLLAFKALALDELDRKDEAAAIVAAMKKRSGNNKSAAWAQALAAREDKDLAPREAIKAYQSALSRDRENPVIRCWIGESYSRLSELDLAMQQWRQAAELMPSWAHPSVLLARAELLNGQTDDAIKHASDALRRAPNLVESGVIMALASYRHLEQSPNASDASKLIAFIQEIQKGAPGEPETLPLLVDLQASNGKRDDAIATIRAALAGDKKPADETLLKLAEISRKQNLGVDQAILAKLPADASNSPRLALDRAMDLARAGEKQEGLDLLSKGARSATTQQLQWKVALAQYGEAIGDPGAKAAWIALGDQNSDDVAIQNLILKAARSASNDRDFYWRTIERVHKLTGDEALGWKLAKARFLLTSDNKQRDSADAVAILTSLVAQSPDTPEYRVLLAAGLMNLGNTNGAIDHLKAAVERDPNGMETMLDLIKLLLKQNRADEARSYMDRASKSAGLTPASRRQLAILLAQQGQIQQAVNVLQPAADSLDATGQLILAELLRKRGDASGAQQAYDTLLKDPNVSADAIASAADFYASIDTLDQAKQTIARLSDQRFTAAQRVTLTARFNEAYVSKDAARDQLIAATNESPTDLEIWRALVEFYIRQNNFDAAITSADNALAKIPNNDDLVTLKAQATALKTTREGQSDLGPLIDALAKDPKNAAQVEMLRAIQDARQTREPATQTVAKLKSVADKYPSYWPLQAQLAKAYLEVNQPNDAANVVERLMDARPNDADAAKLAVSVYRAGARWRDMKRAAGRWRDRTLDHPVDADIALAEAMLALQDVNGAAQQLAPYVQGVKEQPQRLPMLTAIIAKLLVATNKLDETKSLLQPLLSQGPTWRRLWLSLAASQVSPAPVAAQWIKLAAASVPADAFDERFTVAQAWQQMGSRLADKDAIALSRDLLSGLVDRSDLGAAPLVMLASLDTDAGELKDAEALYRRALKLNADLPDALNNLAYILLVRNGDLNEAKEMSLRAIALSPSTAAFHDTLARINEKLDNRDGAISEFTEALRLDPNSLDARIGFCRVLSTTGKRDKAAQELQRIDTQLNGAPPSSESTRRELQSLRESLSSSNSTD